MNLIPILMYHEVSSPGPLPEGVAQSWTVTAAQFQEQLAALAEAGCTGMSVARWLAFREQPEEGVKPVVITFDDGYRGNIENAIPALSERGWSGTFFVISGSIGQGPFAVAADWREAARAGMEVASHTATHPFMAALAPDAAFRELADSRAALEDAIGADVTGFSWPNGDDRSDGQDLLRRTGYAWAATSRAAFAAKGTPPLALPRLAVRSWHDAPGLMALVSPAPANRARLLGAFLAKRAVKRILGRARYARMQAKAVSDE